MEFDASWLEQQLNLNKNFKKAFIHRSFLNEAGSDMESNERLEFLGDSILSFIISSYLFKERTSDAEGDLTNLRSFIVKTKSLAGAAAALNLGSYLKLSKGEELSGGRDNPQILANTFEALLGAIFLEHGLEAATRFIQQSLLPLFGREIKSGPPKDAKSYLQEIAQTRTKQSPKYKILETSGPDHAKQFSVGVFLEGRMIGEGKGPSKQIAEEQAANQALNQLQKTLR
ncbi:ribonuclease III [Candidatus Daviesbacteria bacterium]|nr:ribonuclease III [Candidatus Daviesbacteria bacterium]